MVWRDNGQLLQIEVRCDRTASATVRAAISGLDHLGWVSGDAVLVASELVTHVVTHGGCDGRRRIGVEITETRDALGISVSETDAAHPPVPPSHRALQPRTGLGLVIVDALAREWGTEHDPGYRAWAEISTT